MSEMLCKKQACQWPAMVEGVGASGLGSIGCWWSALWGFCIDCSGPCLEGTVGRVEGDKEGVMMRGVSCELLSSQ